MPVALKCTLVHVNTTNQTSTGDMCRDNLSIIENSRPIKYTNNMIDPTNAIVSKTEEISSDDDFIPPKKATKQFIDLSSSEDEIYTQSKTAKVVITEMLPGNYDYKYSNTTTQVHITVVLDLSYNQRKMQGYGL